MPGARDRNLRSGDLHEDLGIFLLKGVALIAPVPRPKDVGADAFATLIRPEGSRRLIPDLSFLVQLKSASVPSVTFKGAEELAWVSGLEVPLVIGRVSIACGSIELFATHRLHHVLMENAWDGIELLLDEGEETSRSPTFRRVNIGPPIHRWSVADMANPEFLPRAHATLRPHVDALRRNRLLRGIQFQSMLQWETGVVPTQHGTMMNLSADSKIADTLQEMIPHAQRLLMEVQHRKRYGDFPTLLALFDLMRRWGSDPDPQGILRQIVGITAQGPDLSIEDVIRTRALFQGFECLDISRLNVPDEALAAVPVNISSLAVADNPLTDACIPHLLSRQNLQRINLAGTRITDLGLLALADLPHLKWVCVNRTLVTAAAIEQLGTKVPGITVLVDSEPGLATTSS